MRNNLQQTSFLQGRNVAEQKQRKEKSRDSKIRCHDSETALNEIACKTWKAFLQSAENTCTVEKHGHSIHDVIDFGINFHI